MCLSRGFDVSFPCTDGDWKAIAPPMPGLAESGCLWVQSVGWWARCDFRMEHIWSPDAQIWLFGLGVGDSGFSFFKTSCSYPCSLMHWLRYLNVNALQTLIL